MNTQILALAACVVLPVLAAAAPAAAANGITTDFLCDSGNSIVVHADDAAAGDAGVRLDYMGRSFDLYAIATSPGRFATEAGLRPDHGLQWLVEGSTGRLSEMVLDHTAPEPTLIETCTASTVASAPDAAVGDHALPLGSWRLTALNGEATNPDVETLITFNPDGSVNGNGGCNTFGSQAALTPDGLSLAAAFSTRMACGPDIDMVERAFFEALDHTAAHEASGDGLVLLDGTGAELARFTLLSSDPAAVAAAEPAAAVGDGATLIRDVRIFDGRSAELSGPANVLVEGNVIAAISAEPIDAGDALVTIIDGDGRVLMPGLIDAHWHPMLIRVTPAEEDIGFINLVAGVEAEATLMRGFTTVRDLGGPSFGLKRAIDLGLIAGPRIYPSGAMLTVTSGHADFRTLADLPRRDGDLTLMEEMGMSMVVDSPDEVRRRVREQLMQGASQVKLTAGGGVASPFSPLDVSTFTDAELRAAVEAAENWGTYVTAHAYTPEAIQGAIEAGVRVIEHGHLMDEETAQMIADNDVWLSIQPFDEHSTAGVSESSEARRQQVLAGTFRAYALAKQYDIKMAFGTDILFSPVLAKAQGALLVGLEQWFTPAEALAMATGTNGELLLLSGKRNPYPGRIGVVEEGALADLLLVDGNPLEDLSLVADPEANFLIIMKDGVIYKDLLASEP